MNSPTSSVEFQSSRSLTAGDWVRVKSAEEIIQSLDERGAVGGMPFMPEMVPFCGRVFRIAKIADNVCVDNRVRELGSSVILQTERRCDGTSHGGCQFGCRFFWRPEWLVPASQADAGSVLESPPAVAIDLVELTRSQSVTTKNGSQRFVCQATSLLENSAPIAVSNLSQYSKLIIHNRLPLRRILSFFRYLISKKASGSSDSVVGNCQGRTPVISLDLQLGEMVRVRSIGEISETLDAGGCNRGLWFDKEEMQKYCGQTMRVTRRIERIIDECTGELLELKIPSVVLSESNCTGFYRRFCARGMLFMWRECWLERV